MKNFIKWVIGSSSDAEGISLTVKGALTAIIPYVIFASGIGHVSVSQSDLTNFVADIASLVQILLTGVSMVMATYGLLRKLYLTAIGKNAQITPPSNTTTA
jgi:hypothetical protein